MAGPASVTISTTSRLGLRGFRAHTCCPWIVAGLVPIRARRVGGCMAATDAIRSGHPKTNKHFSNQRLNTYTCP